MKATRTTEVWTLDSCKTISIYFIILLRANYLCFSFRKICPYFGLPTQALLNVIAAENKFRSSQLSKGGSFFSKKKVVSLRKFLTSLFQDVRYFCKIVHVNLLWEEKLSSIVRETPCTSSTIFK